jgi:polyisoprenoid-binding protein YceI
MRMWRHPFVRLLGAALLVLPSLFAEAASWRIDPLHSAAHFSVRHMMISRVRGDFTGITGTVLYDSQNPAQSSIEATIDCNTLNTGVAKRDAEMRGPEFFDVKRYPVMKFKSKLVEPVGPAKLKITGDLTINATTREVVLDIDGPSSSVKDPRGNEKIGLSATTKINRKDFGIVWNEIMESGGFTVADEVSIDLDLELIKNKK